MLHMLTSEPAEASQTLPHFNPGEEKQIHLQFSEVDGVIRVTIASAGLSDDINQIAVFLSFALEKLLDADLS